MRFVMKNIIKSLGIVFFVVLFMGSAGCVKQVQTAISGDSIPEAASPVSVPSETIAPPGGISENTMPAPAPVTVTPTPLPRFRVDDVDPYPYITPDPYRLPYRDFSNLTGNVSENKGRTPQFSRTVVLRSNATAFQVNVTRGPFVIDLTFKPLFEIPDQTGDTGSSYPSKDKEDSEETSDSGGSSGGLSGSKSFVYSNAEVLFINTHTNETVAAEGYGGIYSSGTEKTVRIYKEGPYIIVLTGNFIDVNIAITTSSLELPATPAPYSNTQYTEEGDW